MNMFSSLHIFFALLACSKAPQSSPTLTAPPEATVTDPLVPWFALLDLTRDELLEQLGVEESAVELGLAYGSRAGLDRVYAPDKSPAQVYLDGEQVVLVYLSGAALSNISPNTLAARFPSDVVLPSRAGKTFEHHVAAGAGAAWSEDGDEVVLLELFAPMDLERFKTTLYTNPGTFHK